mmetsp:Transcript_17001/g.20219  ORF Transcript_17001/g.20219 Transcript_17001/m.20219 type:complete len:93 (-) Transcript_17001:447-725(-)
MLRRPSMQKSGFQSLLFQCVRHTNFIHVLLFQLPPTASAVHHLPLHKANATTFVSITAAPLIIWAFLVSALLRVGSFQTKLVSRDRVSSAKR